VNDRPRDEFEPATVQRQGEDLGGVELVHACLLSVIEGPDKGLQFPFDSSRPSSVLVGQSAACDVRLNDRQVSRRHLAIDFTAKGLRLRDLESTNGTHVAGLGVAEVYLIGGETVRLGETSLRITRVLSAPRGELSHENGFGRMVGESPEMRRLYPLCARLAESGVPVVIEGETGTGKEVLAEALHVASARASGPFVVFDCTAVPSSLLESALFGHEQGAFTGALTQRRGVFEQAHGGTLFIDEIGELELSLQPKLLRAIERGEVQRVGGTKWLRVDVRIVAATRRDLDREVQAGRFRDDLFYRLAVGRVELPPLRQRRGDIAVLAQLFWSQLAPNGLTMPAGLVGRLEDYAWPGNVRELQNAIACQVALGDLPSFDTAVDSGPTRDVNEDLVEGILRKNLPFPRARAEMVAEFERRYVRRVLDVHGGNVGKAASASGIALRYFQLIKARRTR
jgi:two-component system, NtrC family, response regulator HydG